MNRNKIAALEKKKPPEMFKPLLWGHKWDAVRAWKDRRDIIMAAMTNGNIEHVRWVIKTYGKVDVKKELSGFLETELHSGARNLARALFSVSHFKHAR